MIYNLLGFALVANVVALPQAAPPNDATPDLLPGTTMPSWADAKDYFIKTMEAKPASVLSIPSTSNYPGSKRETVRWGPYTLLAANV
jgi:hypothetical protein